EEQTRGAGFRPPTTTEGGIPAHSVLSEGRHWYRDVVGLCAYSYSPLTCIGRCGANGAGALALGGPEHVSQHTGCDAGAVGDDGGCAGEPGAGGLAADIDEPAVAGGEVDGKARSAIRSSRIELGALAVDGVDVVAVASNECLQGGEPGTAVFFVVDFNSHSQL